MDSRGWWSVALSALVFAKLQYRTADEPASGRRRQRRPPVVVSGEPHQRTLVRPAVVNGLTVSQAMRRGGGCAASNGAPRRTAAPVAYHAPPRCGAAASTAILVMPRCSP